MDRQLFDFIYSKEPKMNPILAAGIAVPQVEHAETYIDRIWRCAARLFPEGLTYDGFCRATPREELQARTRRGSAKPNLELSQSDVYMVKYKFSFNGHPLPDRPIYLPFVRDAGSIFIRGSRFTISPVLADRCLSVSKGTVFIPVTRDKLTFSQFSWQIKVNSQIRSCFVQKSRIHHHEQDTETKKRPGNIQAEHTLAHYLLTQYGASAAFATNFETDVVFGTDDITSERYPEDEWVIAESIGAMPNGLKVANYMPTKIRLAVPKKRWTPALESFVAGFFYVADVFPDRVNLDDIENPRLWRILFGLIIFGNSFGEGKILEDFMSHRDSLDQYIDELAKEELHADGIMVDDIYELFGYIIEKMPDIVNNADVANMEGKRLVTWKYVLYDIVKAIFKLTYKLRPKNKILSEKDIVTAFNRGLNSELIMKINSGHGEVSNISSPGDNMIFKFTSAVIPQNRASGKGGKGDHDRTFSDPAGHLHSSIAGAGSPLNQPKSDPGGASRLNMFGEIDDAYALRIKEKFRPLLKEVQDKIQR